MSTFEKMGEKVIVVVGPTASGKSALAVKLAKKFNGEIVSADSRQVYREMDIGTGKVPRDRSNTARINREYTRIKLESKNSGLIRVDSGNIRAKFESDVRAKFGYFHKGIRHHLLDVVSPKRTFTVVQYVKLAKKAIVDILRRGKLPIIVGGTGFYIRALVDGLTIPEVPPNKKLRTRLEKKSIEELYEMLKEKDPERAATIENKNPRRIVRALEIVAAIGRVPKLKVQPKYET